MEPRFAGTDVVEMGIEIEKNGEAFYTALAAKTGNDRLKAVYAYLADAERKHIAVFREILGAFQAYEPEEAYTEEYFAYMNALAGDHVFTRTGQGAVLAGRISSEREGLERAIDFERKSIVFFEGTKQLVPPRDRGLIDRLIEQENDHIRQLLDVQKTV